MKYLICNLKSYQTFTDIYSYKEELAKINNNKVELIIAPSTPYLSLFKDFPISLCSQEISLNQKLNLTGDISIIALKSLNTKYVIIGHYERRKYYNEDINTILKKVKVATENNFKVILCLGETEEELKRHIEYQVIEKNIAKVFNNIPKEHYKNIIIAYEPTYYINNDTKYNTKKIKKIEETIIFMKDLIATYYNTNIDIVFGGSITPDKISVFKEIKDISGFIIGYSALDPKNITQIIDKM